MRPTNSTHGREKNWTSIPGSAHVSEMKEIYNSGDNIQLGKERGILIAVTSIQTLVEQGGETVSVPNNVFLDQVVRH